jgi:hypothetical protein
MNCSTTGSMRWLVPLLAVLYLGGCTPSPDPAASKDTTTSERPTAASKEPTGTEASPSAAGTANPSSKPVPPAIRELETKLQPNATAAASKAAPPAPTLSAASEERLLGEARALADELALRLPEPDPSAALRLCAPTEVLEKVLNPGYRDILLGSLPAENQAVVERLSRSLTGKTWTHVFTPGKISIARDRGAFVPETAILDGGLLALDSGGVKIEVRLDQLVHSGGKWYVFRISAP